MNNHKTQSVFRSYPLPREEPEFLSRSHKPNPKAWTREILSLQEVIDARNRMNGAISKTPCTESSGLSDLTGSRIFCKREYLQATGSFKERGARNALSLLSKEAARRGVMAASAGNHA